MCTHIFIQHGEEGRQLSSGLLGSRGGATLSPAGEEEEQPTMGEGRYCMYQLGGGGK